MSKHTLPLVWKLISGFLCLAFLYLAISYLLSDAPFGRMNIIGSLLSSLNAGFWCFRLFDHLIIDENGFQYRSVGMVYSGRWSDVQRIAIRGFYEGIYIPKLKLLSGNSWSTPQDLFVPLSLFIPKWQESMLRRRINEHVFGLKVE